ncbi:MULTISPECIES: amino acid-binding protein [unclassified Gordonia (in: high G+C Gram-positive bacteria)]|uniref:amino acid-binding protein n=1 Tax=unclassified Gordonia (in: high G+C Gram-positive bacteria) TaxID=2657482 RepID=UPI001FFFF6FE|nr:MULTISPECIES: amino acid-binding protein [unclassified Gordonia (in: high G+C Gram-positive bacteria)]UQE73966.1 amino acid-binding protein [Gordonia sp. PP30]
MGEVSFLMRVTLTDRPGSLGLLAAALGSVGGDIRSLEVVERGTGYAVDDVVVELPTGALPDTLITAAESVPGVQVDSLRPFTGKLDLHQELALIDAVAAARRDSLQVLADLAPRSLNVSWAMVVTRTGRDAVTLTGSGGAPETPLTQADWLPLPAACAFDPNADWIPGPWREHDTLLAAAPLGDGVKALLLGRVGGPAFRPSEIARLGHLTGIISGLVHAS